MKNETIEELAERRAHQRFFHDGLAIIRNDDVEIPCGVIDISCGGMRLKPFVDILCPQGPVEVFVAKQTSVKASEPMSSWLNIPANILRDASSDWALGFDLNQRDHFRRGLAEIVAQLEILQTRRQGRLGRQTLEVYDEQIVESQIVEDLPRDPEELETSEYFEDETTVAFEVNEIYTFAQDAPTREVTRDELRTMMQKGEKKEVIPNDILF